MVVIIFFPSKKTIRFWARWFKKLQIRPEAPVVIPTIMPICSNSAIVNSIPSYTAAVGLDVPLKNKADNPNNAPISPWCILLLKKYTLGGGDWLCLECQQDVNNSAVVVPIINPPLIPRLHKSPNNITYRSSWYKKIRINMYVCILAITL